MHASQAYDEGSIRFTRSKRFSELKDRPRTKPAVRKKYGKMSPEKAGLSEDCANRGLSPCTAVVQVHVWMTPRLQELFCV
jgi:hypothetical protein